MKPKFYRGITSVVLATALLSGNSLPVWADAQTSSSTSSANKVSKLSLGTVNIDNRSFFELQDVNMLPHINGSIVSFKVTIHNKSSNDLFLIDYWVNVKSKSGTKFSVNLIPDDQKTSRIPANTSSTITYYSNVGNNTNLNDLKFEFVKWDFGMTNNEKILGSVSVPASYNADTSAGYHRELLINGIPALTSIERYTLNKTEKYHRPTFVFKLQNTGTQSFTVPEYEFKLITNDGLIYPLTAKGIENIVLTPKLSTEVTLTGSVPIELDTEGWKVIVTQPITESKIPLPIASYNVPALDTQSGGSIGQIFSFSSLVGDYQAVVNSIHRLPLEDNDLLTADITITNNSGETLTIPNFTGKFILDQNVEIPASVVQFDKIIGLKPDSSISIQLFTTIPYTYEFNEIKALLQEKQEDDTTVDLLEFTHSGQLSGIKTIPLNQKHTLDIIGQRAHILTRKVNTFEGSTSNVFSVQMTAENLEKRFTNIAELNAYFETDNGIIYPAEVEISDAKILPGGFALINIWKQLPKNIDLSKLKLVIGEAVLDEEGKSTSNFVNPVSFKLPEEEFSVSDQLKELEIFPYNISISKIRTQINYESWRALVTFDYELNKNMLVESNLENHKLVLEVSDRDGQIKFEHAFPLDGEDSLEVGKHKGEFSEEDPDLISIIRTLDEYHFNVYHEFQPGQRKLLASKTIRWFTTTD